MFKNLGKQNVLKIRSQIVCRTDIFRKLTLGATEQLDVHRIYTVGVCQWGSPSVQPSNGLKFNRPPSKNVFILLITHRFWERSHLSTDAVGMCHLVRVRILFLFFVFDIYRCKIFFQNIIRHERFVFLCRNFFSQVFPS